VDPDIEPADPSQIGVVEVDAIIRFCLPS